MNRKRVFKISLITIIIAVVILLGAIFFIKKINNKDNKEAEVISLKELPKPEITGGARGELGIDKNINEETIDEYLNRPDSVYRDMRMLEDPGNYEAIGGDRYLSGYVDGFEVVPLPYIIPVKGLPSEVGDTYTGTTLFYDDNGTYVANYEESMKIIEELFPKDKVIFLMCGGGGYAGMTKNFLVSLGWDSDKIYNVGGYWFYKGKHNITVKKEVDGVATYDFDKVPYHNIEFNKLTKSANYKAPAITVSEIKISTSKIEIEEGATFKLNAIVLPNEVKNKEVVWTSSDESVATVTEEGLVKGKAAGKATITVKSVQGGRTATCEVTVNKKIITYIEMDNISKEAEEFASYDFDIINEKFEEKIKREKDSDGKYIPNEYFDAEGKATDLWREEYEKLDKEREVAQTKRIEILDKLIDNKKSFIIVRRDTDCETNYDVAKSTMKILDQKGYSYFSVSTAAGGGNGDNTLGSSKLDLSDYKYGAILIIKDGKLYDSTDPDVDALKSNEDIINWLSKYININ